MSPHRIRPLLGIAITACLLIAAGCGDSDRPAAAARVASSAPRFLAATDLEQELGNGFRSGLYRLAVMSQPRDAAPDLGQDLPTGTLQRVRCAPAATRPRSDAAWTWRCAVAWRTLAGRARHTRYVVRNLPTGCFSAGAHPALSAQRDATIESYSEHPLNTVVSVRKGC
jgi:hypothetical protein